MTQSPNIVQTIKTCKICGDKAKCYNHNGLSCNPCRLFYNRNITRLDKLKCHRNDNCQIDFVSRRCCSKCRMAKCMAIGMNKMTQKQSVSAKSASKNYSKFHKKSNLSIKPCKNSSNKLRLYQYEIEQIQDVQSKMRVFEDESQLQMIGVATNPVICTNFLGVYTRRVIKFCKSMPAFCALNSNDQLIILKRFFIECTQMRILFDYDYENKCHYFLVNESGTQAVLVKATLFKGMKIYKKICENIEQGHALKQEMQNDTVIRDLAMAVLMFQDRDNSCSCPEFIRYNLCIYSRLLCRYFEHKFKSLKKANEKCCRLLEKLKELERMRQVIVELLNEIGSEKLENVLIELID